MDALIHQIASQLRRGIGQRVLNRVHQQFHRRAQREINVTVGDFDGFRPPGMHAAALHAHGGVFLGFRGAAQVHLQIFRRAHADDDALFPAQIAHHGLVHRVAARAHGARGHDAVQGKHADLRGGSAQHDLHHAMRFVEFHARAHRRGHWRFHHQRAPRARERHGAQQRGAFHLGRARRNGRGGPRLFQRAPPA